MKSAQPSAEPKLSEVRATILAALDCYRGDDLERARAAYGRLSQDELQREIRHSQNVDIYVNRVSNCPRVR